MPEPQSQFLKKIIRPPAKVSVKSQGLSQASGNTLPQPLPCMSNGRTADIPRVLPGRITPATAGSTSATAKSCC